MCRSWQHHTPNDQYEAEIYHALYAFGYALRTMTVELLIAWDLNRTIFHYSGNHPTIKTFHMVTPYNNFHTEHTNFSSQITSSTRPSEKRFISHALTFETLTGYCNKMNYSSQISELIATIFQPQGDPDTSAVPFGGQANFSLIFLGIAWPFSTRRRQLNLSQIESQTLLSKGWFWLILCQHNTLMNVSLI